PRGRGPLGGRRRGSQGRWTWSLWGRGSAGGEGRGRDARRPTRRGALRRASGALRIRSRGRDRPRRRGTVRGGFDLIGRGSRWTATLRPRAGARAGGPGGPTGAPPAPRVHGPRRRAV